MTVNIGKVGKYEGYADFGGLPSRYITSSPTNYSEAWVFDLHGDKDGKWHKVNSSSHEMNCIYLTKEEFEKSFPNLPPLPPEAFKPTKPKA